VMRPLRLLFLTPFPPRRDAANGGSRVMAEFLYRLAVRHAVGILYFRSDEPEIDPVLRDVCRFAISVRRQGRGISSADLRRWQLRQLAALAQRKPMWVTDWASSEYARKVKETIEAWCPDVVQIEFHVMGQYLTALRGFDGPKLLTIHEPGTAAMRDRTQFHRGLRRTIYRRDALAWQAYERELLRSVSAAVVFTERDRQTLLPLAGDTPLYTIRPGTPACKTASQLDAPGHSLLFAGSFEHPPNIEAAIRLLTRIFPRVRTRVPDASLFIVGPHPPASIIRAAGAGVTVTGEVADVTPYMERACVILAPLQFGGGIRVKVMEALGFGRAVVATRVAAEGLEVINGKHLVLAETDDEFADAIIDLLGKPESRAALAANARAWAENHLTWTAAIQAYEGLYEAMLQDPIRMGCNESAPCFCRAGEAR
jgi:polysaccharide biosynthesis protein PslH